MVDAKPSRISTFTILKIRFGRKSENCHRFGVCDVVVVGVTVYGNAIVTLESDSTGSILRVAATTSMPIPSTAPQCCYVDETDVFGSDVAQSFGYSAINVVPGCYSVDFTNNVYGDILIPISSLQP